MDSALGRRDERRRPSAVAFVFQCIFHRPTHDELPAENYTIPRKLPYKTNRKSTKNSTIPRFFLLGSSLIFLGGWATGNMTWDKRYFMVFPVQKMGSYGRNTPQKLQKPMRSLVVVSIFFFVVSTEDLFFLCLQ